MGAAVIILGIETATDQVGCAIGGVEGVLGSFTLAHGRRHAETLVPAIQFVCRSAGLELAEISIVAVDVGPGLFTGMRVGIATAKAMAMALRVPMVGIPSLDLLAFPVRHTSRLICAVLDAKRGEVFTALYRHVPGGMQRLEPYRVCTPDELAADLMARNEDVLVVGDGARRHASLFDDARHVELGDAGVSFPSPAALVELAHPRAVREEFVQPAQLEPLYLRKSDAEISWERRDSA